MENKVEDYLERVYGGCKNDPAFDLYTNISRKGFVAGQNFAEKRIKQKIKKLQTELIEIQEDNTCKILDEFKITELKSKIEILKEICGTE